MFSVIKRPEYIEDIVRVREVVMWYTDHDCTFEQAEALWLAASYCQGAKRLELPKDDKMVYYLVSKHIICDTSYLEDLIKHDGEDDEDIDEDEEDYM